MKYKTELGMLSYVFNASKLEVFLILAGSAYSTIIHTEPNYDIKPFMTTDIDKIVTRLLTVFTANNNVTCEVTGCRFIGDLSDFSFLPPDHITNPMIERRIADHLYRKYGYGFLSIPDAGSIQYNNLPKSGLSLDLRVHIVITEVPQPRKRHIPIPQHPQRKRSHIDRHSLRNKPTRR